jgi:hypothetical protein
VYQNFWFDPFNPSDLAGFSLQNRGYKPLMADLQGKLVSQSLGLALVRWQGIYKGINTTWLRWATLEGQLLPSSEEIAEQEKLRAEQEKLRAEQEKLRAEQEKLRAEQEKLRADNAESRLKQVAANLLQQGMTVEQVVQLTALSESEVRGIGN